MNSGIIKPTVLDLTNHSYSRPAYAYSTDELIDNAETQLYGHDVKFDSMVGIGLSGLLVLPLLARHFDVPFFACRKGEEIHHNSELPEGGGRIGKRWILIDDAKVTGNTIKRVRGIIADVVQRYNFDTEYVGTYSYNSYCNTPGSFEGPEDNAQPHSVKAIKVDGITEYVDSDMYYRIESVMSVMLSQYPEMALSRTIAHFANDYKYATYGWDLDNMIKTASFVKKQLDSP